MTNPYSNLPETAFWKTGVAQLDSLDIDLSWQPKFPITRSTSTITVGSCFAQHISTALKKNGFNWLDSEPAPPDLPSEAHEKNNYGVFSFRTGNIYTAALLKQWIDWALGEEPDQEFFQEGERFFDPFRPSLNEQGFASPEHMQAGRRITLAAIRSAVQQANLFIFTLGLTEAWVNRNGVVYPMCPGTVRGEFSPHDHQFHNYDYSEIVDDLNAVFDALRQLNPTLQFLLTVSPVPLTATASGEHVLTATCHSKSVLRAAAGALAKTRADTDYFPSYEIITAAPFKGQFFEANLRSVKPEGVSFVMRQFLKGIGVAQTAAPAPRRQVTESLTENEICDDIILDSWNQSSRSDSKLVLIGDSHMGWMGKMLAEQGIEYAGGGTMNASDWHAERFDLSKELLFLPQEPEQKQQWESTFQSSFAKHRDQPLFVITNLGFQRNQAYNGFWAGYIPHVYGANFTGTVGAEILYSYLVHIRKKHTNVIYRMLAMGHTVLVVSDPPIDTEQLKAPFFLLDNMLLDYFKSIGCLTYSARDWIEGLGGMPQDFLADELIHGSEEYYRQLTRQVVAEFNIGV